MKPAAQRETGLPPGQRRVEAMPIQHIGDPPGFDGANWSVTLLGAIDEPRTLELAELRALSTVEIEADFHAGSGWSVRKLRWRGARLADVLAAAKPRPEARFVRFADGVRYDTSLALEASSEPDVLLATLLGGAPLELAHGGPVRLVVPARYGWKSVKWLRTIELVPEDRPGFWERRGFHPAADPWKEQRFA